MSKNKIILDEIQDQHLDTMIKLAFEYEDALEAQENSENNEDMPIIDTARKEAVWNKALEKIAEMEAEEKKKSRIVQLRRSIPRVIEVAACLILVMGIAAPFAIANVEAIRVKVMELLIDIQDDHTELHYVENEDEEFYVPVGWTGIYYPSYIPDGFTMTDMNELFCDVTFADEEGNRICFSEYQQGELIDINSENAELTYPVINGADVLLIERTDIVIATWATEDRFFVVEANVSIDSDNSHEGLFDGYSEPIS